MTDTPACKHCAKPISERLRKFHAEIVDSDGGESGQMAMTREAFETIDALIEALRPFAEAADDYDGESIDWLGDRITVRHCRAARDAIAKVRGE